jgi:DNA-directed RNA polymerase specialized sigma24 family protein
MICDGIENCIQYIDNFDHNKSSNPFAYFTQIVFYAFLRRIAKEKRQLDIRQKIVDKLDYSQLFYGDADDVASMSDMNSIKEQINSSYYNR